MVNKIYTQYIATKISINTNLLAKDMDVLLGFINACGAYSIKSAGC